MENKINKDLFVVNIKDVKKIKEILEKEKIDYLLFSNVERNQKHFNIRDNEEVENFSKQGFEKDDWGVLAEFDNVIEDDTENESWD